MPLVRANQGSSTPVSGETRSQTEPLSKAIGDTWLELDSADLPKYGFAWRWSGLSWRSDDLYVNYSVNNLAARFDHFLHCDPAFNYWFKAIKSNSVSGQPQTFDHHWRFTLLSITDANQVTDIAESTTEGNPAKWTRMIYPVNQLVMPGIDLTNLFYLIVQPKNSPGALFAAIQLVYNLVRV